MEQKQTEHKISRKLLQKHHASLVETLSDALSTHEDKHPVFHSRADVATNVVDLFIDCVTEVKQEDDIAAYTGSLAEQGMSFATAAHLLKELALHICQISPPDIEKTAVLRQLSNFQLTFLEHLAQSQDSIRQQTANKTQQSLQAALQIQLEQQQATHQIQTQRNRDLNQILSLNAKLALANSEDTLLEDAVQGICHALRLANVTLYAYSAADNRWYLRMMSSDQHEDFFTNQAFIEQFDAAFDTGDDIVQYVTTADEQPYLSISTILKVGTEVLGALNVLVDQLEMHDEEALLILVRTFAQNLAALWHNLHLLQEMTLRTRELEGVYGRFVDQLWREESAALQATYEKGRLQLTQEPAQDNLPPAPNQAIPIQIGDHTFGHVQLPVNAALSQKDQEFIHALVREMGDALHNAYLLQTTSAFSTQLEVAAEVSRAVTTILNRDQLIEEVVTLIQDRFGFYYVGLFLVDPESNTAVLKAGTGEAGRIQLEKRHYLPLNHSSMVGAAIADRKAIVEQDITQAMAFKQNPSLPQTRSELALPLRKGENVIGAVTVQSSEKGAFSQTAVTVLQSLADQLAIAINNASLFAQTEQTLAKTNQLYDTSRQLSAAPDAQTVYQILVHFVANAGLFDTVHIIVEDPANPELFLQSASWYNDNISPINDKHLLRDQYISSKLLTNKQMLRIDGDFQKLDAHSQQLIETHQIQGAFFIPLYQENEWFGTLAMACVDSPVPSDQDIQPFLTLAGQAATILSNRQLLNQTEALYRIGRSITQAITRDDALDIAVKEVSAYTGATQCRLVLYDKRLGIGEVAAASNTSDLPNNVTLPMLDDFVYSYLNEKRGPLLLEDGSDNVPQTAVNQHVLQFGAGASMLIPSASQQELIGYLAIDSAKGKRPFRPSNITFAQTILDHITTQIENIKLLDEALSRAQELITLNQIQSNISGVLDIGNLATAVYEQVGRLLDNTIFILAQFDPEANCYTPILTMFEGNPIDTEARTLLPGDLLYQYLQDSAPLVADNQSPLLQKESKHYFTKPPQSALWIPLQQEGKTIGLISVQSYNQLAYSEQDIQLLRSIATHTSLAIANAQLFETIQANNEELRQLDHLKNQFLANMSHELRTPLNSIIGFSRVILKGIDGPITQEQEEDLSSIYNNGQHLLILINEILDMAKIDAGKMSLSFSQTDLIEAAEAAVKTVRGLEQNSQVNFLWDVPKQLPHIEADPVRIRQVLLNLITNAFKYTKRGTIQLKIRNHQDHIRIMIQDTGIGIPTQDYDKVFAAFEQVDNSTTRTSGGTGLGLPITKWIVEMHQGKIWFESKVNQGTIFHITLPVNQKKPTSTIPILTESLLSQHATQSNTTEGKSL